MAYQEGQRAKQMENPTMCRPVENNAKRYTILADKLEAARRTRSKDLTEKLHWL